MAIFTDRRFQILIFAGLIAGSVDSFANSGVVGTGTPATCTQDALAAQISAAPSGGTITFNCGGNATVAFSSQIEIAANTTIDGASLIVFDGGSATRLFTIDSAATLTLKHMTLTRGVAGSDCSNSGGAVCVNSGASLVATNVSFFLNYAGSNGGAIENAGTATLTDVYLENAAASMGGSIDNSGTLTMTNSVVANSRADGFDDDGFPPPYSPYGGGGLLNSGSATITNSLFFGNNTLYGWGGAIRSSGPLTLAYSDIIKNNSGVVAFNWGEGGGIEGPATLEASIVDGNTAAQNGNCGPAISGVNTSLGYNISGGCGLNATGDVNNPSFTLPTIVVAGGPNVDGTGTPLIAAVLAPGSAAIDAIPSGSAGCGTTVTADERGQPRPANGGTATRCDIGAFELQTTAPPSTGSVTVYKYLAGAEAALVPGATHYPVSLNCGSTALGPQNVSAGSSTVFNNVPVGTCTVSEQTNSLPVISGIAWAPPLYLPSASISVYGGLNTNATVGNTANAQGSVVVTNVVDGPAVDVGLVPDNPFNYAISLSCGGTVLGPHYAGAGQSTTFLNAPGGTCTVSEAAVGTTGAYVWETPVFSPSASITVTAAGTEHVTVTNTADFPANSVVVTMTLAGDAAPQINPYTTYSVSLTCGSNPVLTSTVGPLSPAEFKNVPAGSCTLGETAPTPVAGVTWQTPTFSPSATFTMTGGATHQIDITNTATITPDTVVVFVYLTGPAAMSVPRTTTFPIKLTCGSQVFTKNIGPFSATAFNTLPVGSCTIGQNAPPTVPGVVWGTATYSATATTVTASSNTEITVVETANTSAVSTGTIAVFTSVTGSGSALVDPNTSFSIAVTCGSNAPMAGSVSEAAPTGFFNLPVGTCAISEGTLPPVSQVVWGAPTYQPGKTVSVVAGGTTFAYIRNLANADTIFADGFE